MLPRRKLDWRSATTFVTRDPDWRAKVWRGGLWLLFPPIGWPAALGYRKELITHLAERREPLLPEWEGRLGFYWGQGMRALGVIFAYNTPIVAFLAAKVLQHGTPADFPWLALAAFFAFFFMLTPFVVPLLVTVFSEVLGGSLFSTTEVVAVFAYFVLATFLLPAGFLQVSRTGRFLAALRPRAVLRFVFRNPRLYLEAWLYSGLISLAGHFCVPLSPWGIFWCYQSIVYSFNEVRLFTDDEEDRELQSAATWYRALRSEREGGSIPRSAARSSASRRRRPAA